MSSSKQGKQIDSDRGYAIHKWTGDVDGKPFSVRPQHGWDGEWFATLDEARDYLNRAPALRTVEVSFSALVPVDATDEEIEEWVEYELHAQSSIHNANPLSSHALEAHHVEIDIEDC